MPFRLFHEKFLSFLTPDSADYFMLVMFFFSSECIPFNSICHHIFQLISVKTRISSNAMQSMSFDFEKKYGPEFRWIGCAYSSQIWITNVAQHNSITGLPTKNYFIYSTTTETVFQKLPVLDRYQPEQPKSAGTTT